VAMPGIWLIMRSITLDLGEDLSGLLAPLGEPIGQSAREMIVFELYRRGLISSGKGADLMGIPRLAFIQRASDLGIPYFRFTDDEWQAEVAESERA
jgi:predicted HTH domain antitoxin